MQELGLRLKLEVAWECGNMSHSNQPSSSDEVGVVYRWDLKGPFLNDTAQGQQRAPEILHSCLLCTLWDSCDLGIIISSHEKLRLKEVGNEAKATEPGNFGAKIQIQGIESQSLHSGLNHVALCNLLSHSRCWARSSSCERSTWDYVDKAHRYLPCCPWGPERGPFL